MSLLLILIGFIFSTFGLEQNDPESILEIRRHFNYVQDNLSNFEQRKFEDMGRSTEGGEGTMYFDNGKLVKISIELYGETGRLEREFYLKNEELIFVFDINYRYNMPMYMDETRAKESGFDQWFDPEKTMELEDRFYFKNGELIRWIDSDKKYRPRNDSEFSRNQEFYMTLG